VTLAALRKGNGSEGASVGGHFNAKHKRRPWCDGEKGGWEGGLATYVEGIMNVVGTGPFEKNSQRGQQEQQESVWEEFNVVFAKKPKVKYDQRKARGFGVQQGKRNARKRQGGQMKKAGANRFGGEMLILPWSALKTGTGGKRKQTRGGVGESKRARYC